MMEEDQDNKLSKQKKRLFFIPFLLFAMMSFLDMLIIQAPPNNPWMQICFLFCFEGMPIIFKSLIILFAFSNLYLIFCSQSLLSCCLEEYWAAYDKSG